MPRTPAPAPAPYPQPAAPRPVTPHHAILASLQPRPCSEARLTGFREEAACCAVCQDDFTSEAVELPCAHAFHGACAASWLAVKRTCPLCRARAHPAATDDDESLVGHSDTLRTATSA